MGDERQLVEDASRGDRTAAEDLLARHLPALLAFIRRRGADLPRDKESASDLVQSVCREVLEQLEDERVEYRGEAEFRAWLYEAALFKIKNRRRFWNADRRDAGRERRPAAATESDDGGLDRVLEHPTATPSEHAVRREERDGALALLEQLPERYRQVVELAKLEGLEHREIARRMGITEAASRMLLSRALARLATLAGET